MAVNAYQTITSAWTETIVAANPHLGQKGYVYGTTGLSAVLANTANCLVSLPFGQRALTASLVEGKTGVGGKPLVRAVENKKITIGINVSVGYDDVVALLDVQGSLDGTNWGTASDGSVKIVAGIADTTPNVTGVKQALVSLVDVYTPFLRLAFNSSGLNCGTTGQLYFLYAIPIL